MVSLIVLGAIQFLLLRILFALGDGSFLDKWNRMASPVAIGLSQFVCLAVGIYMIVLMKGVCNVKDDKSKVNYRKYLNYSYRLLILYNALIVIAVFSYALGVTVRGPERTSVSSEGIKIRNLNQGLTCMGALCVASQVVVLGFLFECIKSMKFGNDMERRPKIILNRISE
ncbi:hypothetical protein BC833DRAFT_650910 [Globomyces pollinis-pini]|nr:hypothetical protein BC833DRAFT_650910 [Globomyces pollinis-pini]